ncbi:immunoglobulin superfamily member 6 [Coregonus clupeaformis]|uniref:immunoglobulin superfamily member 6 n=1 Tax=Coregonus clupeaformis TaxID=59861 RepID=UPI001BDFD3F3|nr:immunoglobulin superfamily member 6 [Coregonus clupeaformis]XP_041735221.1 immunoglobulin superfamily member 6 [Coregonus clupeaformis]XP_041735222.1 immunoglobulin superfamily member 6 [Coregonus clupeaformis]
MWNKTDCLQVLSLHQPDEVIWRIGGQTASLPCNIVYDTNMEIDLIWFVFKEDAHHSVDLMTQQHKYSLERNALNINSLQANDSGVYHCAALFKNVVCSGAQEIGQGTTLVVREMTWHVLLWLLFVLLALYSLAVLIRIICKKTGKDIAVCRGTQKSDIQKNTVRVQFGAVVQELYGKRNLQSNKKNPNHSGPAQNKVESPHSNHPEDIYQNQ